MSRQCPSLPVKTTIQTIALDNKHKQFKNKNKNKQFNIPKRVLFFLIS